MKGKTVKIFNGVLLSIAIGVTIYFWNTGNEGTVYINASSSALDVGIYQDGRKLDAVIVDKNESLEYPMKAGEYIVQVWNRDSYIPKENQAPRRYNFEVDRGGKQKIDVDYKDYGILKFQTIGWPVSLMLDDKYAFSVAEGEQEYLVPAGQYTVTLNTTIENTILELEGEVIINSGTTQKFGLGAGLEGGLRTLYDGNKKWVENPNFKSEYAPNNTQSPCAENSRLPTLEEWKSLLALNGLIFSENIVTDKFKPLALFLDLEWEHPDPNNELAKAYEKALLELFEGGSSFTDGTNYYLLTNEYWTGGVDIIKINTRKKIVEIVNDDNKMGIPTTFCYCVQDF